MGFYVFFWVVFFIANPVLKGEWSGDEYFLQNKFFCVQLMVFKIKIKVFACFYGLINFENPFSTPLGP